MHVIYVIMFRNTCSLTKFTDEEIDRAVGLLWTNSFACCSGGGQAIFPIFSLISHACTSNCSHSVFPKNQLALQAKCHIKKGEEITISYISSTQVYNYNCYETWTKSEKKL